MKYNSKWYHVSQVLVLVVSILGASASYAYHNGDNFHNGGWHHGYGDNPHGYHQGGWGYHGDHDYDNYNGYWGAPNVIIQPGGGYLPPYCQTVKECYSNGTCVEHQVCN
jgi:hypothetical protein